MELLKSSKFTLPKVFFITERKEIKDIPIGIPFIYGEKRHKNHLVRLLEYEVLYQTAIKSGYPFNFKQILRDNGYKDIIDYSYGCSEYMEFSSEGFLDEDDDDLKELTRLSDLTDEFSEFIKDSAVYVDIQKLKDLNVFPVWLDTIEQAISTNIHNFAVFNNNMYNKKLEGIYGGLDLTSPSRNLIIIDISGSIPKGVSSTCLALCKNLSETFYADLLITGSKSTLYAYEELYKLNINTIYDENGMDNDQVYFKKLVSEEKVYKTAIVFGDNDYPGYAWSNEYNKKTKRISDEAGKKLCKWKIDKLISFHTKNTDHIAAYGRWFSPLQEERINNWVKYLDNN